MEAKLERWGEDLVVRLSSADAQRLGLGEGGIVEIHPADAKHPPAADGREDIVATVPRRRSANGLPVYTLEELIAEARRLGPDFEPPSVDWGPDRGSEVIDDDNPR
jgi:antitoxin MazE